MWRLRSKLLRACAEAAASVGGAVRDEAGGGDTYRQDERDDGCYFLTDLMEGPAEEDGDRDDQRKDCDWHEESEAESAHSSALAQQLGVRGQCTRGQPSPATGGT